MVHTMCFLLYNENMKIFKKIVKWFFILILFLIFYSFGSTLFEHVQISQMVDEFKSRAYDSYELNGFTYHPVKREHDYELYDERNVFSDAAKMRPGVEGDVLATQDSPFPYVPVVHEFVSFYFGGHAALVSGPNNIIQSTGVPPNGFLDVPHMWKVITHPGFDTDNSLSVAATETNNYWLQKMRNESHAEYPYYGEYYREKIFTLRPRYSDISTIDEEVDELLDFGQSLVGRGLYNYLWIFDTEYKYYCSDLVSRAFETMSKKTNRSYNLNQDGFITTINDIIISKDVYLTIFKETVNDEIHIYYLEDVV